MSLFEAGNRYAEEYDQLAYKLIASDTMNAQLNNVNYYWWDVRLPKNISEYKEFMFAISDVASNISYTNIIYALSSMIKQNCRIRTASKLAKFGNYMFIAYKTADTVSIWVENTTNLNETVPITYEIYAR